MPEDKRTRTHSPKSAHQATEVLAENKNDKDFQTVSLEARRIRESRRRLPASTHGRFRAAPAHNSPGFEIQTNWKPDRSSRPQKEGPARPPRRTLRLRRMPRPWRALEQAFQERNPFR